MPARPELETVPTALKRLIYVSRQEIDPAVLDQTVGDIIRVSVRNNRAVAITGLLLVHGGHFVQALEGPADAVMETFDRIRPDPRHARVEAIVSGPCARREFEAWHMCARHLSATDDAILDTLSQRDRFEPYRLGADAALRLLKTVSGVQQRARLTLDV